MRISDWSSDVCSSDLAQAVGASGVSGARIINNTITATQTGGTGTAHGIDVVSGSINVTVSGNTITASGGGTAIAIQVLNSSATVTGNSLSASGGSTNNHHTLLNTANILAGSSGNTVTAGACTEIGRAHV